MPVACKCLLDLGKLLFRFQPSAVFSTLQSVTAKDVSLWSRVDPNLINHTLNVVQQSLILFKRKLDAKLGCWVMS